ncbi:uncharacterized protein LOC114334111 [Diabrotica virgifera virgifera]|uniref:Ig-like domain-containing protein n=2 Tax=Diabrotica virgifera virgifera TaxID=50390 RepID=A0ABM5K7B5_DIAVI|nr:uncharacterized protein LOC114334111 [Diabrotica virgifera virgifera]
MPNGKIGEMLINMNSIVLFVFLSGLTIFDVRALRNMQIRVPEAVKRGDSVTLVCDYDLESAALYTIKWYRDDEEFYRFVPKESPPSQAFTVSHVNVDLVNSNSTRVTLKKVERDTAGKFKCEVSADAPLFHTDIRTAELIVADVPEDGPVLRTEAQKVAPGEKIKANCTTPGSYPTMNISWFANNIEMHSSSDVQIDNTIIHFDALPGLETILSTISIRATPSLFKNGKLKLRCLATMFTLYTSSKEADIQEASPQLALIMVPSTSANGISVSPQKLFVILHTFIILLLLRHTPG